MRKIVFVSLMLMVALYSVSFAANELAVKDNSSRGSKPGYIEKATLVVEPFGGYVVESLYLEYSDRHQFTSNLLEIVHRFELPKDAVVNDMWLWMGNNVMQARMFDTWSARHIYDSIAATKYDPAFLAKTGSQYELRIYPLEAGKYRKVKISFIVPTLWYGNQATAELPLKMLLANHATVKPLEILFRTQKDIWGVPSLAESPQKKFVKLVDTLDYKYQYLPLDDISQYSSLNLKFNTEFINGYYLSGYQDKSDSTYFQLGILPKDFFKLQFNTSPRDVLVALDLSGSFPKKLTEKLTVYQSLVDSSLKSNDNFKFIVSGNETITDYTNTFLPATSQNINSVFQLFGQSDFAKAINQLYMPIITFCDGQASTNWNFTNLSSLAHVSVYGSMQLSASAIAKSDVVAAYNHGFESPLDDATAIQIENSLDTLFANGGRFLTYYDYNRESYEKLARHYIQGLKVRTVNHAALTLYRNPDGNIGMNFPESFTRNASYFFEYTDPDVKVELMDITGKPAVISKRIGRGIIVVTGIWSLNDDAAMRTLLGAPLLGINSSKKPYELDKLLERIKQEYNGNHFSKVILLSDSDSLIAKTDASLKAQTYINGFGINPPKFYSVNLLGNDSFTPGYITDNQTEYYGSGYFLEKITEASKGIHMEKHVYDWSYIASVFSPYSVPYLNDINITTNVDNGTGKIIDLREVNKFADPNKPRFFLGKADAHNTIVFNVSGRFEGADKDSSGQISFLIPHDTTTYNTVVKSVLGNEEINDKFYKTPIDTAAIIRLSLSYNLLTDYTALLALEPDSQFHFIRNPFDESGFTNVKEEKEEKDSTVVSVYPNPFNSMTNFIIRLKSAAAISASVYNILGQKVIDIVDNEYATGVKRYSWSGKNSYGSTVASGFYIFRVIVTDAVTKKANVYTYKLIYLK